MYDIIKYGNFLKLRFTINDGITFVVVAERDLIKLSLNHFKEPFIVTWLFTSFCSALASTSSLSPLKVGLPSVTNPGPIIFTPAVSLVFDFSLLYDVLTVYE